MPIKYFFYKKIDKINIEKGSLEKLYFDNFSNIDLKINKNQKSKCKIICTI
jgi:hypothetical protein